MSRKFSVVLLVSVTCFCALYLLRKEAKLERIAGTSIHTSGATVDGPAVSKDESEFDHEDSSSFKHKAVHSSKNSAPSDTPIQRTPEKSFQTPQQQSLVEPLGKFTTQPQKKVFRGKSKTAGDQPPSLQDQDHPLKPSSQPVGQLPVHVDHLQQATPTLSHDTQLTESRPKVEERGPLQRTNVASDSEATPAADNRASRKFPQVIIIGVRKAGTRALINMLNSHPDIVAAKGEVHYFDRDENFKKGIQWYINRMPLTVGEQLTVEKSPNYFVSEEAPKRMKSVSHNLKLLLTVRDPVERLISDFTQLDHKLVKKEKRASLEHKVLLESGEVNTDYSPVTVSMYHIHMKHWLEFFSMKSIHIVNGDTLIKHPVTELKKVEVFLGVRPFFQEDMFYFNPTKRFYCWKKRVVNSAELVDYCLDSSKGRPHPKVDEDVIRKLKEFYRPHNQRFYSLVNQTFGW